MTLFLFDFCLSPGSQVFYLNRGLLDNFPSVFFNNLALKQGTGCFPRNSSVCLTQDLRNKQKISCTFFLLRTKLDQPSHPFYLASFSPMFSVQAQASVHSRGAQAFFSLDVTVEAYSQHNDILSITAGDCTFPSRINDNKFRPRTSRINVKNE